MLPNPFPGNNSSIPNTSTSSFKAAQAGEKTCLAVLIADASGSMASFVKDTVGGANAFVNKLKEGDIKTNLLFVTFEDHNVTKVIDNIDVKEVPQITTSHYQIGGMTNLLDAIGQTIEEVNTYLRKFKKKDRPSVLFQIITDGQENNSRHFNNEQLKEMVTQAQQKDWVFAFVGANIDSFAVSSAFGIAAGSVSNYTLNNTTETFGLMATSMTNARSLRSHGLASAEVSASYYSNEDRKKMEGKK